MEYNGSIVIAGAGAAGVAAAISSARQDSDVLLIEKTAYLGGTVTQSLIHTLGGIYDSSGRYINYGLPVELTERLYHMNFVIHKRKIGKVWTLVTSPEDYAQVMENWLLEEPRIKVFRESSIASIIEDNGTVRSIELRTNQQTIFLKPKALIDTTGSAEMIRKIDPNLVTDDQNTAAAGLIFKLKGVKTNVLKFPKNIGIKRKVQQAVKDSMLSAECSLTWIDNGIYEDEAYIKLQIPLLSSWREEGVREKAEDQAINLRDELVCFLNNIPGFENAYLANTGALGIRDGGRIKGEFVLTESDVRGLRKFEDAACRCCWPIEYWEQKNGVEFEYLPDGDYYEIPLRSLKVYGMQNV